MADLKRLNFFTGFFTTADDWNAGQEYHQQKRRLHNRGLHTAGVIQGEGNTLAVESAGGLNIRVLPGVALDGAGNEIVLGQQRNLTLDPAQFSLPQLVYIGLEYHEELSDYVENVEAPQCSGHTRVNEAPRLVITTTQPDNLSQIELARIDLQSGVTEVSDPADPANPVGNEIDRRFVVWAGSIIQEQPTLPVELQERLILLMQDKRRDFAALDLRFPVPSLSDVRHAALTLELLSRLGSLEPERINLVFATFAALEQDIGQELGASYPALVVVGQYQTYLEAVDGLSLAVRDGESLETLLTRQGEVAEAARELSETVLRPPEASGGVDQTVETLGDEANVVLDARGSQAFEDRTIVLYRWDKRE